MGKEHPLSQSVGSLASELFVSNGGEKHPRPKRLVAKLVEGIIAQDDSGIY
jgi:hypothetical protein